MVHWNDPVHIKKLTTSRGTNSLKAPLEIANVSNSEASARIEFQYSGAIMKLQGGLTFEMILLANFHPPVEVITFFLDPLLPDGQKNSPQQRTLNPYNCDPLPFTRGIPSLHPGS